jgi:hypothetical protein
MANWNNVMKCARGSKEDHDKSKRENDGPMMRL